MLTFALCLKERLMSHAVSAIVSPHGFKNDVKSTCSVRLFRLMPSDWILPGSADSIGSDRVCLPTFSTPLAPANRYFRCHLSSPMHPFPLPVAIGFNPSANEENPTQVECTGHVWYFMTIIYKIIIKRIKAFGANNSSPCKSNIVNSRITYSVKCCYHHSIAMYNHV